MPCRTCKNLAPEPEVVVVQGRMQPVATPARKERKAVAAAKTEDEREWIPNTQLACIGGDRTTIPRRVCTAQ